MSAELDALTAQVHATEGVIDSAIALLNGLAARIDQLIAEGTDPAALQALSDEIKTKSDQLAAAVAADTRP